MTRGPGSVLLLVCAALVLGCSHREPFDQETPSAPPERELLPAGSAAFAESAPPELADDSDPETLRQAIESSLAYLRSGSSAASIGIGGARCRREDLERALRATAARVADTLPDSGWFRERFRFFRAAGQVRLTGYYEPILQGRLAPEPPFLHPLYRRPSDLVEVRLADFLPDAPGIRLFGRAVEGQLRPYFTRAEIDGGRALAGRGLEIAWVSDPVELFFLHVQGSGVIQLEEGRELRVGYAASNGHPYTSIGKLLQDSGRLARGEATAPAIRRWLRDHPAEAEAILFANERYVFFRVVDRGPVGSLGVPLVPGRSLAADPVAIPPGVLAWLDSTIPRFEDGEHPSGRNRLRRFVAVHDTGAALVGPGRIDLFLGTGDSAGRIAGSLSEEAELYVLFPRCEADGESLVPGPALLPRR
jgi:membrane-bound lytic murein transglycosylase A